MHKSFLNWVNRNLTKHDTINDTEQCFCSYSPGNKKTFNSFRFHWKSIFAFFFSRYSQFCVAAVVNFSKWFQSELHRV